MNPNRIAIAGVLAWVMSMAPAFAWVDARYAKADDFNTFIVQYMDDAVTRYEEKVEELSESIRVLEGIASRTVPQERILLQKKDRKEMYLRKIDKRQK